jgi:5-methylcytosine-specific restriction endonuclease McrA
LISNCKYCHTEIKYNPSQSSGSYCSNVCQQNYQFLHVVIPRVERGEGGIDAIRRYLKHTRQYVCEVCGNKGEHCGESLTLQVDHIDGNSDNGLPINLRWLCPNCHSQTPTYKGGNKKRPKNTRRNIKQREAYKMRQ